MGIGHNNDLPLQIREAQQHPHGHCSRESTQDLVAGNQTEPHQKHRPVPLRRYSSGTPISYGQLR